MKIKYSSIKSNRDTEITIGDNAVTIDGEEYEFPVEIVEFTEVAAQTGGVILEAHRAEGELYLTVLRRYTGGRPEWDTGEYHET